MPSKGTPETGLFRLIPGLGVERSIDGIFFAGPVAEICHLAAFRAEWAKFRLFIPDNLRFTAGAVDDGIAHNVSMCRVKERVSWGVKSQPLNISGARRVILS